jgi:3-hydroxyisobutyrate dehydrogenase-like beta-hydroxyacid dehydrogenase
MEVGFIGLGRMGRAMARNLLKAGHHVFVFNRTRAAPKNCATRGRKLRTAQPARAKAKL